MTDEEHQSILKAVVAYAVEETKRVCFAEMDNAMAELTEAHVASAKDAVKRARAEQAAELAKWKALAETLDVKDAEIARLREALERIKYATMIHVRAGEPGYVNRHGLLGIANKALAGESHDQP